MLLRLAAESGVVQKLARGTPVRVFSGQIGEVIFGEGTLSLTPAINEWDVGGDALVPQPVNELGAAIAFVRSEALGLQPKPCLDRRKHLLGRSRLRTEARRGGLNSNDDAAFVIDQIGS